MNNKQEIWKDYLYVYQISNLGNIRNKVTGTLLKIRKNHNGYLCVCISLGSRDNRKTIRIHRAVAETFIPNPENKPQVNHINGDKTDNRVENLEWCTNYENQIHARKNGLNISPDYFNNKKSKLSKKDVEYCQKNYKPRDKTFGMRALERKFKISHQVMWKIIHDKIAL